MMHKPTSSSVLRAALRRERLAVGCLVALLCTASLLPLASPVLLGRFVDAGRAGATARSLAGIALTLLVVELVAQVANLASVWLSITVGWRAGNRVREQVASHLLDLDMAWHGSVNPGQLIERVDTDPEAVGRFLHLVVVGIVGNAVLLVGVIVMVTRLSTSLGVGLAVVSIVAATVTALARPAAVRAHAAYREAAAQYYGDIEERLTGLEDLRANGGGAWAMARQQRLSGGLWRAARHQGWLGGRAWALTGTIFNVGFVALLAWGAVLVGRGALTAGGLIALFRYTQLVNGPIEQIGERMREFQRAVAGAGRIAELLGTEPTVPEGRGTALPSGPLEVEWHDVSFSYRPPRPTLQRVDLVVPAGTSLGLVGTTGAGKTTLARLAARLWLPASGQVRIGGIDLAEVDRTSLRDRVAVVPQEVHLFHATVRDNLTLFGRYVADDDRLTQLLGELGLGRWLARLPDGFDTWLAGAEGLSAGQAQLLGLGRMFLADPGLVVLDEATARLDRETEAIVTAATIRLLRTRTAVVVAHRLSTLDRVDAIAVVEDGRVIEHGPRTALAANASSRYAALLRVARLDLVDEGVAS